MYDVIVVGGGPAGSTAAYWCVKFGLKTLLLEKAKMPRDKPCGGAAKMLSDNYPLEITKKFTHKTPRVTYIGPNYSIKIPHTSITFKRIDFDNALFQRAKKAGVETKFEEVTDIKEGKTPEIITKNKKYKSKIVIAADGASNHIAKKVGLYKEREQALTCVIEDKTPAGYSKKFGNNLVVLEGSKLKSPGFYWFFPKGKILNVGGGCTIGKNMADVKAELFEILDRNGIKIDRSSLQYFPLPLELLPKLYKNNIMLVGDSAGFVDPTNGAGIGLGMVSGKHAAETAKEAVDAKNFSEEVLKNYESKCEDMIIYLNRLRWGRKIYLIAKKIGLVALFARNKYLVKRFFKASCKINYKYYDKL